MKFLLKKYLSKSDLGFIAGKIAQAEHQTLGEIRVSIRHKWSWRERKQTLHEIALAEFYRLGMQKTKDRTGVLILLLMSERKFHIIADEGIHLKVEEGTWDRIAAALSTHFKDGQYAQGIGRAVESVGEELKKHVPGSGGNHNELPNDVVEH